MDYEISRYKAPGNNQRESEKKIMVKKIGRKRRMEILGHKRMRTEARI